MKQRFKSFRKRKIFKRKAGGAKFMLGGKNKSFEFNTDSKTSESAMALVAAILGMRSKMRRKEN